MMPLVAAARARLRRDALLGGVAAGLIAMALVALVGGLLWGAPVIATGLGLVASLCCGLIAGARAASRWTPIETAAFIEARTPGLDNLIVTATALASGQTNAPDRIRAEVSRQAAERASLVQPAAVVPLGRSLWLAAAGSIGALALIWSVFASRVPVRPEPPFTTPSSGIDSVRATITPPAYLGRAGTVLDDPETVTLPAGSRLTLEVRSTLPLVWLAESDGGARPLARAAEQSFSGAWVPDVSRAIVIAAGQDGGTALHSRLIDVVVEPDQAPRVRVVAPGRDLAVATPTADVPVVVEAEDAERLDGLRVTYVRASGSGESFAFEEGQLPVTIERDSTQRWRGRARLSLPALKLEDGDSVVYRASARDSNPAGDWVSSEAFTVDVGRTPEFAGAGFAVPGEDRRYAISQQMVIVKTERLQAARSTMAADPWSEAARLLAMEQRMVRSEVVFLSGGEVEDEVAEAEQSSELQEGRLENAGRLEMLRAINEMSRAEARLSAGDTSGALGFERAALAALQRAFDRRRYFLRTLGERSRIDGTRRLTGNLEQARSWTRTVESDDSDPGSTARALIGELAAVSEQGASPSPALVARLAAADSASGDWRRTVAALAAAATPAAQREAAQIAMARLALSARARAGASLVAPEASALRGWWNDESRSARRP